ncbi:penicillin-binding protein 1B [Candidatus Endobugula sertula]|uniref:Penicillin-binding protein 1B n=1 Tax=Candidatus Endobugula sertula TaxID=62101 RepID=A0A1D2QSW8_9GAMM|nr:penicillin-binding protein 1B [Candidatus Endobugula sertula]
MPPVSFVLYGFTLLCVVTVVWVISLDRQVREKFTGKKWAIPARVYARPLDIYEGLLLKSSELERELTLLGYRPVKQVWQPGQYSRQDQKYEIYTRDFIFPDKEKKAARYGVTLDNGYVSQLKGVDDDLSLRLEPKEIGSIYPHHGEDRVLLKLVDIPLLLGQTLIAVEDKEFARHHGISLKGIARAMLENIKAGAFVQGGSTLTQQLVKNFYLTHDRHLWRKVQEAVMSLLLEYHYNKAEILETYLNEVYLGQSGPRAIHGFGLAAKHYFNRPIKNLQPHQIALLVAVVKGASYYNPWRFPERAKRRRNTVLQLMADHQLISQREQKTYANKPLEIIQKSQLRLGDYPAFMGLVKRQLQRDYNPEDLQSEGLRIFTTMSPNVQELTETVIKKRVQKINNTKNSKHIQAAAVITAVGSGEILALVGDKSPRYQGFNRAIDMQRPIGSLVKPFVYLAALSEADKYNLVTLLEDSPIKLELDNGTSWEPKNFSNKSYGDVPLYQALAQSYNQATVNLGMSLGLDRVIKTLQASGLENTPHALPSLLLGAIDLSPLEISHLYHTIAADGAYTPLRAIRAVLDSHHQPLQRYPLVSEPRIPEALSYLAHYSLQAVMSLGSGKRAYQQLPKKLVVAGKTGTTNQQRDSWFAGYSADHLGVIWLGNDDNRPTHYTGSSGALPIWADIFQQLSTQGINNVQPSTIKYYWVDGKEGLLSAQGCEGAILAPFIAGSQPVQKMKCEKLISPISHWLK